MRLSIGWGFLLCFIISACSKHEQVTADPTVQLIFDKDSVLFDTIFTTQGSITKRIKIKNDHRHAVTISEIKLAGSGDSPYRININGVNTNSATNVPIGGKDSLNIFVKVTINPNLKNLPFLVQDSIILNTNGNRQVIQLSAYGQNAIYMINQTITQNTTWNSNLPYIINGSLTVKNGSSLNILPGTKVYFHKDASLNIEGNLNITGALNQPVLLCSDRLENAYTNEPGQWKGLYLSRTGNAIIQNAIIKNASVGITSDSLSLNGKPKLLLSNTIIKNMQVAAYIGYHSELSAFNNLIYNCGNYIIYAIGGGNYNLKQNTFAGYNYNFPRKTAALTFSDYLSSGNYNPLNLNLTNNIIWGNLNNELEIQQKTTALSQISVWNNLIKSSGNTFNLNNNILNVDPGFISNELENFELADNSITLKKGINLTTDANFSSYLQKDMKEKKRTFPSALGCYEKN
ncbi:hypothetical protein [Pedobacter sp. N23S346]|uniref:hypothetical protein n=1 Tax=Pedobacter sp. N23S346 TaxID=3402750 RepID=UPI003AC822C5